MELVTIDGESYFKIAKHDKMRPFFMSIVSDSNHWMFISSNGGLSAGRKNAEFALFPYYTDDKITEFADITGSKSIFQIQVDSQILVWEPFTERFNDQYRLSRNLYKNIYGNKIIFEEIHHDLNLTYRYHWNTSNTFGFIKKTEIINQSDKDYTITFLDGIQNIMPYGVNSELQSSTSNLVDAYKRNEIHPSSGLGIFGLSAIIVDKAEPSEALKANIAWSLGIENPTYLLSSLQIPVFRKKQKIYSETDIKGEKGAYFVSSEIVLVKNSAKNWKIIANVNQNQSQVVQIIDSIIKDKTLEKQLIEDIDLGNRNLISLNASADGIQFTADKQKDTRHFANVLFNCMRGGVFDFNYQVEKTDFVNYLAAANKQVCIKNKAFLDALKDIQTYPALKQLASNQSDIDLFRLCMEYLPLKFSRRHGDPSRPWNKFSINTRSEIDGSKILDYQGNWRDIFQNWEALAYSFPEFIEGMIFKFLNATTFDGYNPYRVTKSGFDWETIEPENEWSYIGYWGDHQIIYLLKFLEFIEKQNPGKLNAYFDTDIFVYAAVPYHIKSYESILQNPKDTIEFDHKWNAEINDKRNQFGADGALINEQNGKIYHVNFIEKILATVLAKMSNFIPEGGIWMNTQRPEWNDANNALVGNGVSMVTLYYLRRFLVFFHKLLETSQIKQIKISSDLANYYHAIQSVLVENKSLLNHSISDIDRKKILDKLGKAASDYRQKLYSIGFSGDKATISLDGLKDFCQISLAYISHTIKSNKREDKLYHAYNLMAVKENGVIISNLSEMLEGQVAVISSGYLDASETLEILHNLRNSALYRPDQNSYILYPNKELPGFLQKNKLTKDKVSQSILLQKLLAENNFSIINQDLNGDYHFDGNFNNANSLQSALSHLAQQRYYKDLVEQESATILQLFEEVFNHKAFTGRSGTFFAYEGLGSIYWHMVSKLHLAVQEVCIKAINDNENSNIINGLITHYEQIGDGIGLHKSPEVYGAFPTDPYSHTPLHRGAQQPGMTGQVKEDVLTRIGELGIKIQNGRLQFCPKFLQKKEFLNEETKANFIDIESKPISINLPKGSLGFTFCQIPIIYNISQKNKMEIEHDDGTKTISESLELDAKISAEIFGRSGKVRQIKIDITEDQLK
jgi:hypothetical protein